MKKQTKKLKLAKETVSSLDHGEMMKEVVGGITEVSCGWACFATKLQNSNCAC